MGMHHAQAHKDLVPHMGIASTWKGGDQWLHPTPKLNINNDKTLWHRIPNPVMLCTPYANICQKTQNLMILMWLYEDIWVAICSLWKCWLIECVWWLIGHAPQHPIIHQYFLKFCGCMCKFQNKHITLTHCASNCWKKWLSLPNCWARASTNIYIEQLHCLQCELYWALSNKACFWQLGFPPPSINTCARIPWNVGQGKTSVNIRFVFGPTPGKFVTIQFRLQIFDP